MVLIVIISRLRYSTLLSPKLHKNPTFYIKGVTVVFEGSVYSSVGLTSIGTLKKVCVHPITGESNIFQPNIFQNANIFQWFLTPRHFQASANIFQILNVPWKILWMFLRQSFSIKFRHTFTFFPSNLLVFDQKFKLKC